VQFLTIPTALFGAISAQSVPEPNSPPEFIGPGGLAYKSKNDPLYVASMGNNEIFAVKHASKTHSDLGMGVLVYQDQAHLRGPIGLALAPNGDLLATNGDAINADANQPRELIEFTPQGQFVGQLSLDPALGAAFQVVVQSTHKKVTVATVNDNLNTLDFRTITT
jgi:DNA-binding beta-propeller fold protein YncE